MLAKGKKFDSIVAVILCYIINMTFIILRTLLSD